MSAIPFPPAKAGRKSQPSRRWKRWWARLGAGLLLAIGGMFAVLEYAEYAGNAFYRDGRAILATLTVLGDGVKHGNAAAVDTAHDPSYRGRNLGLTHLIADQVTDGIRRFAFAPGSQTEDRVAAVAEWVRYQAGFETVEEAALHIGRILPAEPGEDLAASVRFELIGT